MEYIVIDLEWNQPTSYHSPVFKAVGDRLLFELIQIGAVKMDEKFRIIDAFSMPIKPAHYVNIHPRIKRMTKLGNDELENAPGFLDAMASFVNWCGSNYALLTWGCDDVSVLKQNMDFFECESPLPPLCDIQLLFSEVFKLGKDRKGLKHAMEMLEIDPQEDKNFHNALNDAYYTAQVFRKLPSPEDVLRFVQQPKRLLHVEKKRRRRSPKLKFGSVLEAFENDLIARPKCPVCGRMMVLEQGYTPQSGDKYIGIANCENHGYFFVKLRFMQVEEEKCGVIISYEKASPHNMAYIRTKRLQYENKHKDAPWDYENMFKHATRTNMHFEE